MVHYINHNFKGTSKNSIYLSEEESDTIKNSETIDAKAFIDYYWNPKTGTHLVRFKSQEKINNSGHYYFHVFENLDKDYLEFNFSIPKYVYGTNVMMFCEHYTNRNFICYHNSMFDYNFKRAYDLLIHFITNFFDKEFIENDIVDFSDVEINRIDLCFNQVFYNKREALQYLEYQKKVRKKNLSISSDNYREYESSFMFTTKRYSAKIYHKGTEYTKHDRKEHERINKQKGREYFNINALQDFSDRMLRYEITFRDTMLSYLFNHKVFRKNCPIHKQRYEIYKKVESAKEKNERIAQRTGSFKNIRNKQRYIDSHPFIIIDRNHLAIHNKMSKLLNRKRQFLVKTNRSIEEFNSVTMGSTFDPRALFSKALFLECAKFFKAFITEFQIKEKPSEAIVRERIDKYNSEQYHKLPKNNMLRFFKMLENSSFDEIRKGGYYPRSTFFKYKQRFAKIGITQNYVMPVDHINVPVDFSQYHHSIMYEKPLINR